MTCIVLFIHKVIAHAATADRGETRSDQWRKMLSFASTAVIDGNVILRREYYFLSDRYEMQRLRGDWSFPHDFSWLWWVEEGQLALAEERCRI